MSPKGNINLIHLLYVLSFPSAQKHCAHDFHVPYQLYVLWAYSLW